ncbi:MAG: MFS transporter [Bifidobacteriaceae bacterium]|nr:MFS transporter [Bifidobacteriaceae bacterium]
MSGAAVAGPSTRPRLWSRDFGLLVGGQVVSVVGSAVLRFALDLYVLDMTGRADVFALVLALSTLPGIVFTPIGGAIADRFSKRRLMVVLDAASAAVVAVLICLMGAGWFPVPVVGLGLAALCLVSSMYQPTVQSAVPALAPDERLADANGMVSGVGALSALVGPVLGGVLYGLVGIETLLGASCVAFAAAAVMEVFVRIPFTKRLSGKSLTATLLGDVREGLVFAWRGNPVVFRVIVLACAVNLAATPVFVIGVPYILRFTLGSSDLMYGVGLGCTELASVVGAVGAGLFTRRLRLAALNRPIWLIAALMVPMALAMTPAVLHLGYWPPFGLFFAFEIAALVVCTAMSVYVITQIQKATPDAMLGKVMGLLMACAQVAAPLGQALYGLAFETFSAAVWVPVLFASAAAAGIAVMAKPLLRNQATMPSASLPG